MSRNAKIILAIAGGAVVLLSVCMCVTVLVATVLMRTNSVSVSPARMASSVEEAIQVQPGQAEMAGDTIASIALPAGWQSDYSMNVAGFRLAGYKPESGSGHIILALLPETPGKSTNELENELRGLTDRDYRWNLKEMTVIDRKQITVNGQATEMVISEGTASSGTWRQAMTSFRGPQGLTLLIYGMPKDTYRQADADALFASIH